MSRGLAYAFWIPPTHHSEYATIGSSPVEYGYNATRQVAIREVPSSGNFPMSSGYYAMKNMDQYYAKKNARIVAFNRDLNPDRIRPTGTSMSYPLIYT